MKKIKIVGYVFTVLAFIFVIKRIISLDIDFTILFTHKNFLVFAMVSLAWGLQILLASYPWKKLVLCIAECNDERNSRSLFCYIYSKSNVLKYIPGNVFQYVGRNEIAVHWNISHGRVALATVFEIALNLLSAGIVSAICAFPLLVYYFVQYKKSLIFVIAIIVAFFIAFIVLNLTVKEKLMEYMRRYKNLLLSKRIIKTCVLCCCWYIALFVSNGIQFLFILNISEPISSSLTDVRILIGAFTLSWLIGYVTPGAPGGIGIREAIMIAMMSSIGIVEETTILTTMLLYRMTNIIGDVLAFIVSMAIYQIKKQ